MSKFRARALDTTKYMPIFRSDEIPDLPDFAAINRSVPQMPTGMEKDEECEHHLQRAMSAQQSFGHTGDIVIPTPEVFQAPEDHYNELYPDNYKFPRQLIHVQPFSIEQDTPDYDMDSDDEIWLNKQKGVINLSEDKFEEMMDRLEKSSGQHVLTLKDAKALLKEDDDLIISVYDYWLNKRLKTQQALIYLVKTERRDGTSNNNPYVAFRRRTEKMQTRKNRKNDEASYEKMLKLRRDLTRAVKILQLVKERESAKHEHLRCTVDIFDKRYHIGDYNGQILAELSALRHIKPTSTFLPINNIQMIKHIDKNRHKVDDVPRKKREYRKRHKQNEHVNVQRTQIESTQQQELGYSSDDEMLNGVSSQPVSDQEEEDDPDGPYAFKRKKGCTYHAPLTEQLGNWPWCETSEGGAGDKRFRFCLTTLSHENPRCIGFARRRIGRGGRIIFDRAWSPYEDYWSQFDFTNRENSEFLQNFVHFRPKTPPPNLVDSDIEDINEQTVCDEDGNEIPVVPITSFSDYVNESELYSSTNTQTLSSNSSTSYSDIDITNFRTHQEQLFEMQRKQLERLKRETESANCSGSSNVNNNNYNSHKMCNHDYEHSSLCNTATTTTGAIVTSALSSLTSPLVISSSHLQSSISTDSNTTTVFSRPSMFSSTLTSPLSSQSIITSSPLSYTVTAATVSSTATVTNSTTTTTIPQASTLDLDRVQLAVSAVLSASEVLNSLTNGPIKENNEPPSQQSNAQKDTLSMNIYRINCQNSKDLSTADSTLPPTDVT